MCLSIVPFRLFIEGNSREIFIVSEMYIALAVDITRYNCSFERTVAFSHFYSGVWRIDYAAECGVMIQLDFQQRLPHFAHYAFTEVSLSDWTNILKDLQLLRQKLSSAQSIADIKSCLRFPSTAAEETFNVDYHKNVADLGKLIDELTAWIERSLAHFDTISILGL